MGEKCGPSADWGASFPDSGQRAGCLWGVRAFSLPAVTCKFSQAALPFERVEGRRGIPPSLSKVELYKPADVLQGRAAVKEDLDQRERWAKGTSRC